MRSPRPTSALPVPLILALAAVSLSACGSAPRADPTSTRPTAIALGGRAGDREPSASSFERVRGAVLRGAAEDFARGTGIGGPAFESCLRRLLGRALDRPTIARLAQVYRRPDGQQLAAQALNALASPLAAKCGHRAYVPELVEASRGLRDARAAVPLPTGWHEIGRPITGVLYPKQVLAAATYPIVFPHRPGSCFPKAALRQMPADGVLLQLIEYPAADSTGRPIRVPDLPPRPRRFSYADATYAMFECAGPSYKFDFKQSGRAFQAQVWLNRKTVDPRFRAEALRILDGFHPTRAP